MSWADQGWLVWLAVALALAAIEAASADFVFIMLSGGALAGMGASALGVPLPVQVVVAVIVGGLLLFVVRPMMKARFMVPEGAHGIGAPAQVGRSALVISTVTERDGRIKLSGETWSARVQPGSADALPGQEVRVVSIEGATAIVTHDAAGLEAE